MQLRKIVLVSIVAGIVPICAAQSQSRDSDSTSFHAGQWGAEFSLGSNNTILSGAGLLRFFSPRRALSVDLSGGVSRQSTDSHITESQSNVMLKLGSRWYHPTSRRTLYFFGVGALATGNRGQLENTNVTTGAVTKLKSDALGAGAYADLGGSWMVTSNLSLSAAWQGTTSYGRGTEKSSPTNVSEAVDTRFNVFRANLGSLSLRAGIFF